MALTILRENMANLRFFHSSKLVFHGMGETRQVFLLFLYNPLTATK
jgi:hypothetical protein